MQKTVNNEVLTYALEHHAKGVKEIVGCLALEAYTRLAPLGWKLSKSRQGANSYYLERDGVKFYFRAFRLGGGKGRNPISAIRVHDKYYGGTVITVLATRRDVLEFVTEVEAM